MKPIEYYLSSTPVTETLTKEVPVELTSSTLQAAETLTPPSTPSLPDALSGDFLIREDICKLPCWQGLHINQSNENEVLMTVDKFFVLHDYKILDHAYEDLPADLRAMIQNWVLEDGTFGIGMLFDKKTHILNGLSFGWSGQNQFESSMRLQPVLRQLGLPTQMLIKLEIGGSGNASEARMALLVIYDTGIILRRNDILPVIETNKSTSGQIQAVAAELCLDENYYYADEAVFLVDKLDKNLDSLSSVQQFFLPPLKDYIPIADISNLTLAEITDLANSTEHACLRLDLAPFQK